MAGPGVPARPRRRHDPVSERLPPPAPSAVDLHTHTRRSDGLLEPLALVRAAAAAGVRTLAITDHDTLAAYRDLRGPSLTDLPAGLDLLPGVEINAVTRGLVDVPEGELHVLGYGMDPADEAFEATLARQRGARRLRFERTVERLRELGRPIDAQVATLDPADEDSLGRPTIGRALMAGGFADSVEDAFARLIGRGRPAYVPREGLGPREAIDAIRAAGGIAVLAHFGEAPTHRDVLAELIESGLGGLEVYYRAFDAPTVAALCDLAAELRLLPTGGSDYHGDTGPYAAHHAELWVPAEVADGLRAAIALAQP